MRYAVTYEQTKIIEVDEPFECDEDLLDYLESECPLDSEMVYVENTDENFCVWEA